MKNSRVKNIVTKLLSNNFYILKNIAFDYKLSNGIWVKQKREVYDRGDGAGVLLYNKETQSIILTKQFRLPTYLNGNTDGFLVEICAGMLDTDEPEDCIIREIEEEVGYKINHVKKVYEAYASPGVMTEKMHFFIAEYTDSMKVSIGGGLESEHEDIEVLEMSFSKAIAMLNTGKIKDMRTIILLQYAQLNKLLG